jgi:BirA family biotin operon repressor/biotin-[acetyl-CoA-carboxylase] ligase
MTLVSPALQWTASYVFVRHAQASLTVAEWLESRGYAVQLKWPNDLYLNGQKLGGFLTEAYWQGGTCTRWFLGIGINVTQAPEGCAWLPGLELDGLAELLADLLASHLESPVGSDVLDRYASKLLGWRQLNRFRDRSSGETFAATPKFLSPDGRLGIQLEHGSVRWVGHKELEWLVGEVG